jgi:hypothetical protein
MIRAWNYLYIFAGVSVQAVAFGLTNILYQRD